MEDYKNLENHQTKRALWKSEERLRMFIAASSSVIYRMNADWTIMENLVGKELLADISEPITNWINRYIWPEDQPQFIAAIQRAIAGKSIFELEHKVKLADGTTGWLHSRAIPLLDEQGQITEWFGTGTDISERRRIEKALLQSTEKYRTIFDTIDEGFCVYELVYKDGKVADLRWTEVNPAYEKQTGLKDTVGKLASEVMPGTEDHWLNIYEKVAITGESVNFESWHAPTRRWYYTFASKMGGTNKRQVAVLFSDITERKRREANMNLLNDVHKVLEHPADIDEMMSVLCEKIGRHFDASICAFAEVDETTETVNIRQLWQQPGSTVPLKNIQISDYTRQLILSSKPEIINSLAGLPPNLSDKLNALNIGAYVNLPFVWDGKWQATLSITDSQPRQWQEDDLTLMHELTFRIWTRLERARIEETLRKNAARMIRQKEAFQLTINGALLKNSLNVIAGIVADEMKEDVRTAFYIADTNNNCLHPVIGAGSMDEDYLKEIDGFLIGENSISCGLAVYTGTPVLITDVCEDPSCKPWLHVTEKYGYRSSWSFPVKTKDNKVVGIFALYFGMPRKASPDDIALIEIITQNASVIISNYTGIQERDRAEQALRESEIQLKQLLKLRDEFIGVASHELKTPVTSIKAYAEIVQERLEELGSTDDSDLLIKLNRQIDRLTSLINNLLDTTKISEGQLQLTPESLNINELLRERIGEIKRTSNHSFDLQLQDLSPVTADRERIGQVITNLLSNAIKYSPKGTTIKVTSIAGIHGITVSIEDKGYGIPASDIKMIFDKFFRVTSNNMDTFPGMGLGLYITTQILHKHKGNIAVESVEGQGSVFSFTLPYGDMVA